jgi:lipopolysaccharide biosynthesis glycosyltransferase
MLQFDGQQDGTNAFIYSRYLVPYLNGYNGWAIFCDGDMAVTKDILNLWKLRDESKAVMVVKHDYQTKFSRKYIGSPMENDNLDYQRKNWSSVMLINCGHPSNRFLTPQVVQESGGAFLHRFKWLTDDEIGELPAEWNHLVGEYEPGPANLYHWTLGCPGMTHYATAHGSKVWNDHLRGVLNIDGERIKDMVARI